MSTGKVLSIKNESEVMINVENHNIVVNISEIFNSQKNQVPIESIEVGDNIIIQGYFILEKQRISQLSLIKTHPLYSIFDENARNEMACFRSTKVGPESLDLALGISLIEIMLNYEDSNVQTKLMEIIGDDENFQKIISILNENKELTSKMVFKKLRAAAQLVEKFIETLLRKKTIDTLLTYLNICICYYDKYLKFLRSNHQSSNLRVNLLELSTTDYSILYSLNQCEVFYPSILKDKNPNNNAEFRIRTGNSSKAKASHTHRKNLEFFQENYSIFQSSSQLIQPVKEVLTIEKQICFTQSRKNLDVQSQVNMHTENIIMCEICKKKKVLSNFLSDCKHSCTDCLIDNIRKWKNSCEICSKDLPIKTRIKLKSLERNCDHCKYRYSWIQGFPYKVCEHNYCFKCSETFIEGKTWKCPNRCTFEFEKDSTANNYIKSKCKECKNVFAKSENYYIHKSCRCNYCINCIEKFENSQCKNCKASFSSLLSVYVNDYREEIEKRKRQCPICTEIYDIENIISFQNCSHYVCESCMKNNVLALFENSEIVKIYTCPVDMVTPIAQIQLEELFSIHKKNLLCSTHENDIWNKINYLKIKNEVKLTKCKKCMLEFMIGENKYAICPEPKCAFFFCTKCMEAYHPSSEDCRVAYIKICIAEMERNFPGQPISQCPGCKIPYLKDSGCNHVQCNACKLDFCFNCSAFRSPILKHGNHYHRPQCENYFEPGSEPDIMKNDCTECVKLGALCPRPGNLIRNRRFDD